MAVEFEYFDEKCFLIIFNSPFFTLTWQEWDSFELDTENQTDQPTKDDSGLIFIPDTYVPRVLFKKGII